MRTLAFFLFTNLSLLSGELRVTIPNDEYGFTVVESMSEEDCIENPEAQIQQEGQTAVFEFQNLKPGKYRVSYILGLDPLAYLTTIMETHVEVSEQRKASVILFQPWPRNHEPALPKDVEDFLMDHRESFLDLDDVYDGSKRSFELTRGGASRIGALRTDCEYHIKVWNHSSRKFTKDRKVIFEKTFRAVARDSDPSDPFAANGMPQKAK